MINKVFDHYKENLLFILNFFQIFLWLEKQVVQ